MPIPDKYRALLHVHGGSLAERGANQIGLPREHALAAVNILRDHMVPILGGDVWVQIGAKLDFDGSTWYCNRADGEDAEHYAERSWSVSEAYIRRYPELPGESLLFVIVVPHEPIERGWLPP